MLRIVSNIIITQQPTTTYPNRSNVYTLNFVTEVEIKSSWKDLTTTAKLVFPRNIYVKTPHGNVNWFDQAVYAQIEGNTTPPIILRGDRISINLGYYHNPGGGYITEMNEEFNGFITKINPKMPMEIECEDNMWLLKQALCPNKVFKAKENAPNGKPWNVQSIVTYLLSNSSVASGNTYVNSVLIPQLKKITVINGVGLSESVETHVGDFRTQNETIAQVLFRLRKDYKLECFFRKNLTTNTWDDLYCSGIVYYPSDYINPDGSFKTFAYDFQNNITQTDNLVYLRKDDVRLGIRAYSVAKYELTSTNSAGKKQTKNQRLSVNVGDQDGDIRTQFFFPATNTDKDLDLASLKALALQRLTKLKYEGWRGSFSSFGLPYVQHGMAVSLTDSILKERQGIYLVKGTTLRLDIKGQKPALKRTIELHIRIDNQNLTQSDFENGL